MDDTILTVILAALSVALLVWGVGIWVGEAVSGDRKKLAQRLAGEGHLLTTGQPFVALRREIKLTGVSGFLVRLPGMVRLHLALEQTWPGTTLAKFLAAAGAMAFLAFVIVGTIFISLLLAIAAAAAAVALPFVVLSSRRSKRQRMMAEEIPEALDFLGRILRAGHSLSTGLQMVGQELPEPLAGEFRRAYDDHSLGRTMDDALKDAAARIASTDFGFFVTAVLIQRQTGGDLSEVLNNISDMIRGRLRLQQHVKAKTAEGRFSGYILTAFPIVMFFVSYALNPAYASVLLHGIGLYLLIGAGVLCLAGLLIIRKITTVRV
jgi:tight adherence protein B